MVRDTKIMIQLMDTHRARFVDFLSIYQCSACSLTYPLDHCMLKSKCNYNCLVYNMLVEDLVAIDEVVFSLTIGKP